MNMISFLPKSPNEICRMLAANLRTRRKMADLSQEQLSHKSGVSLGSLKRFEHTGDISLSSLVKLSISLGCEDEWTALFAKKPYNSIQEVLDEKL